ncbi:MAG: hypothetical protein A2868_02880 [Candidatus Levybacteria bacterium RIFCSPHIGHO2_01_FULL_40_15b]|nr:MAG: hypothetical protein A2868_02880 [Candidatus Levybacteria bacterium RIFCSPHIGHO2_01_FULL_40_15b]
MAKIESGEMGPGFVPQESIQKEQIDDGIFQAVIIAIGEHKCSSWTPDQRAILEEGEYGLLSEAREIFGSFRELTAEVAIRALQEKHAPDPLEDDLNMDIFAPIKRGLRGKSVPVSSLPLVKKVFREALVVLETEQTINELSQRRRAAKKEMASRTIVPRSARRSEQPRNPFNRRL